MEKQFIRDVKPYAKLYRDTITGIAWIEDGSSGCGFSCHSNIDSTGSVSGMKHLGYWSKNDRTVRSCGFIYNIDSFVIDKENEFDNIVANECMCQGCLERRNNMQKDKPLQDAKKLWKELSEVNVDENDCIEEDWHTFEAGTYKIDIWHWFEDYFGVSVAEDLMGTEEE